MLSRLGQWFDYRFHRSGMFGRTRSYRCISPDGFPIRVLDVGGVFQSATYLNERRFEAPFRYLRSFEIMFETDTAISQVLMLGGGGFSYPKHLLFYHDDVSIDVVEIDPSIVEIARKRFFLNEAEMLYGNRLEIIVDDARHYLLETDKTYDAILVDLFCGDKPSELFSGEEGYKLIKKRLNPSGLFLSNVVIPPCVDEVAELQKFGKTTRSSFCFHAFLPAEDEGYAQERNYILIAGDDPRVIPDELQRKFLSEL